MESGKALVSDLYPLQTPSNIGIDKHSSTIYSINGKSFGTPYEPAKYTGPEPKGVVEGGQLYTGSCHCGAVKVAFNSKPLNKATTEKCTECNCSICNRVGIRVRVYSDKLLEWPELTVTTARIRMGLS